MRMGWWWGEWLARVISTSNRHNGWRNVTCHIISVRLCLFHSEVSMSAKALEKVAVEVYQIKSLPADTAPDAGFHLNSDWTLTFCIRYCTSEPCIDFYLRVCDKQCSWSKHPFTFSLPPLVVKGRWWKYKWVSGGDWGGGSCGPLDFAVFSFPEVLGWKADL